MITPAALSILKMACIDKVYGAFAMTTLRELVLTRARQRKELLKLLLEFSYFEQNEIKDHVNSNFEYSFTFVYLIIKIFSALKLQKNFIK